MFKAMSALRGAAATLASLTLVATTFAQPAAADAGKSSDDVVVRNEPGVVTVTIPSPARKSKNTPAAKDGVQTLAYVGDNSASHCSKNAPPCQFNIHKTNARGITPPGGSYGELKSTGTAFVDVYTVVGCCFTQADYYSTVSSSQWGGTNPWNATSIKHTDVWDIDYAAVSWSFGGAPSGTVNLGSGRIAYENTVSNTWRVTHDVQHVYLRVSGGNITKVRYEAHGSYGFGSQFWTTDAYSAVALP